MRKKLTGFTLAEALVTIGLIGVVAVLTMPNVFVTIQGDKWASALGKNVETIERSCQNMVAEASSMGSTDFYGHYRIHKNFNGKDIGSTDANTISGNNLWAAAGSRSVWGVNSMNSTQVTNYQNRLALYEYNSPKLNTLVGSNLVRNTKLGSIYGTGTASETAKYEDPILGYIYIDVNGEKAPNRYGRDIFLFGLTDACRMIPAGSERMRSVTGAKIDSSTKACNDNIKNGLSCTNRVVQDGYKMKY